MPKFIAPALRGRMLPALFSAMPFAKKARFEGDPWPTFAHSPTWSWMHSDACRADPAGSGNAVCHDRSIAGGLRETRLAAALVQTPTPPAHVRQAQIDLFQGIEA